MFWLRVFFVFPIYFFLGALVKLEREPHAMLRGLHFVPATDLGLLDPGLLRDSVFSRPDTQRLDACTVHAVLTPSRRLRDEVVERCKKIWPANMLLPLGRTEEGDAHFDHALLILREQLPGVAAEIQQSEDDLVFCFPVWLC